MSRNNSRIEHTTRHSEETQNPKEIHQLQSKKASTGHESTPKETSESAQRRKEKVSKEIPHKWASPGEEERSRDEIS